MVSVMGRGHCCQQVLGWLCELIHMPLRSSACAGPGTSGSQGVFIEPYSFRSKYIPNYTCEALEVSPSPHLQTRKRTRLQITCSGSSPPGCSPNLVRCPVGAPDPQNDAAIWS